MTDKIWYLLVNHEREPIGRSTKAFVSADTDVEDLTVKVQAEKQRHLAHVNADELEVWMCNDPELSADRPLEKLRDIVGRIKFSKNDDYAVELAPARKVMSLHLRRHQLLLIRVPGTDGDTGDKNEGMPNASFVEEFEELFVKVKEWGVFHDSCLGLNYIERARPELVPDFVAMFNQELSCKRVLASDARTASKYILHDSQIRAEYFAPSEGLIDAKKEPWLTAELPEVMHIGIIASEKYGNFWEEPPERSLKDHLASSIFFHLLALHVPENKKITVQLGKIPWPFELIMDCAAIQSPREQLRKYRPCSDFLISKSNLPRLFVEVSSATTPEEQVSDKVRILLAGAAVVRFANLFLDEFEAKDFVLVAIIIGNDSVATWYTLFQQQNKPTVYYSKRRFSLNNSLDRVRFARFLYNVLHAPGKEENSTSEKVQQLEDKIAKQRTNFELSPCHSKKGQENKRNCAHAHDNDAAETFAGAGGVGLADYAELRAHGYEVKTEDIVDASGITWKPLFELPSRLLTVHRMSRPSMGLVAKKVREESDELEILKLVTTSQKKCEHVISLVDSFQGHSGLWAILPKMDSVAEYIFLAPNQLSGKVSQICWGLIEGLAFLHELCIAHMNIKPDSLLVSRDFYLKIAGFDIALILKDEDEEVDDQCGPEDWMAPEVGKLSTYSPLKADRWSCGGVILYLLDEFKEKDKYLNEIARKLKVNNPNQRPSLLERRSWFSSSGESKAVEREALEAQEDVVEVGGENSDSELPKAKRQKLSEQPKEGKDE